MEFRPERDARRDTQFLKKESAGQRDADTKILALMLECRLARRRRATHMIRNGFRVQKNRLKARRDARRDTACGEPLENGAGGECGQKKKPSKNREHSTK